MTNPIPDAIESKFRSSRVRQVFVVVLVSLAAKKEITKQNARCSRSRGLEGLIRYSSIYLDNAHSIR